MLRIRKTENYQLFRNTESYISVSDPDSFVLWIKIRIQKGKMILKRKKSEEFSWFEELDCLLEGRRLLL